MKTFKNLKSDRKKELAVSFLKTKQKQKFFYIKKNHSFQKFRVATDINFVVYRTFTNICIILVKEIKIK